MSIRPAHARVLALASLVALLVGCAGSDPTVVGSGDSSATESAADPGTPTGDPSAAGDPGGPSAGSSAASDGSDGAGATGGGGAADGGGTSGSGPGGGGGAAAAPNPLGGPSYTNPAFGYTVRFPAGWTKGADRPDGRGADFTGPGGAKAAVDGSNNITRDNAETICGGYLDALRNDGGDADLMVEDNRCWITGNVGGTQRQMVSWVGAGSVNTIDVSYPASAESQVDSTLQQAAGAFTTGDLATGH